MADEITATITFTCAKGGAQLPGNQMTKKMTMAGANIAAVTQNAHASIGTSIAVTFGDISGVPKGVRLKNLDDVAVITFFGASTPTANEIQIVLGPGEISYFQPLTQQLYMRSTVSASLFLLEACDT